MTVASPNNVEDLIEKIVSVLNESGIEHIEDELRKLHPADIARLLESIPPESRELIWPLIDNSRRGETLVELSEGVREGLMAKMDTPSLAAAVDSLDTDEIADLIPELPDEVIAEVLYIADREKRDQLNAVLGDAIQRIASTILRIRTVDQLLEALDVQVDTIVDGGQVDRLRHLRRLLQFVECLLARGQGLVVPHLGGPGTVVRPLVLAAYRRRCPVSDPDSSHPVYSASGCRFTGNPIRILLRILS